MKLLRAFFLVAVVILLPARAWAADHQEFPGFVVGSGIVDVGQNEMVVLGVAGTGVREANTCNIQLFEYDSSGNVTVVADGDAPRGFGFVTFEVNTSQGAYSFWLHLSCSKGKHARSFISTISVVNRTTGSSRRHTFDYFTHNSDDFVGNL